MPIVLVEGVNKVGKSSVCDYLNKNYAFHAVNDDSIADVVNANRGYHARGGLFASTTIFEALSSNIRSLNLIVDRFHLTEFVYGVHTRGYSPDYIWDIDSRLKAIGVKLLYMTDSVDNIIERNMKPGVNKSYLESLICLMEAAYRLSSMDKMTFNWLTGERDALLDWIYS